MNLLRKISGTSLKDREKREDIRKICNLEGNVKHTLAKDKIVGIARDK